MAILPIKSIKQPRRVFVPGGKSMKQKCYLMLTCIFLSALLLDFFIYKSGYEWNFMIIDDYGNFSLVPCLIVLISYLILISEFIRLHRQL